MIFRSLTAISEFVSAQAITLGFSAHDLYAIQTAVDEACANIIDHAYGEENLGYIEIHLEDLDNGIKIIIKDDGNPFDPKKVPEPEIKLPLEQRRERGLGVFIIKKLMDSVHYDFSNPHQNVLTLIKLHSQLSEELAPSINPDC